MDKELQQLFLTAVIAPIVLAIIAGIGWLFKTRREDKLARDQRHEIEKVRLLEKIEELQATIFRMQQERIADEANKRQEADVTNRLLAEMTVLLKTALAPKG